ncbi:MAG: hypothetical protein LWW77_04665, partial [Propionibacteriales bacterium]|nr:hypothetical protein [Propionibacteriales bacterium]
HSCAVITDGTVDCWGANSNGTLGLDLATTGSSTATLAPLASGIAQIFASNDRTCGLTTTRDAVCWGTGSSGGLGNGLSVNEPTPQTVTAVSTTVTSLATGANHTCASTSTGGVRCWGQGTAGQLGLGSANTYTGVDVPNLPSNVTSVAGGSQFSCALSSSGAVMCWGANTGGQLGRGSVDSPNTTSSTTPVSVTGLSSGVTAITTGWAHACALMSDSTVKCWGGNASGQLGIGTSTDVSYPVAVPGLTGVVAISAGMNHTCAVTSAGAAWCWGANTYGALGDGTTTLQKSPQLVPTLGSGVVSISAGTSYTCAVLTGGAVQCWGYNNAGQLGLGNTTNATTPQPVIADGMTAVTTGSGHTCALATDGSARCWGGNTNGQLGAGDLGTHSTPTLVSGLTNVSAIRAGGQHTCAVSTTGVLTCWGSNTYSALGINTAAFPAPQTVLGVRS